MEQEPKRELVKVKDLNKWARRQAVLLRDDPEQWDTSMRDFFAASFGYEDWDHMMTEGVEDLPRLDEICWHCNRPYEGET